MNFMEMTYDQQNSLIAQLINSMSQPDHGDQYIAAHPELKNREVINWLLQQATMYRDHYRLLTKGPSTLPDAERIKLANDKIRLATNMAGAAWSLGGDIGDKTLGARAIDFIIVTSEEIGDNATAQQWRVIAAMIL